MASHREFVEFITEQLREAGDVRARPMFGEYGLYSCTATGCFLR